VCTSFADPVAAAALALLLACGCAPERGARPDRILLVTVDTLRADHVGSYGSVSAHTPQMDTVAAQGVRFAEAISPAPLTLPAHASILTGLDPPAHGVRHNSIHRLADDLPTLPERMREAGYATAAFVGSLVLDRRFGLARGFDHYDDRMGSRRSARVGFAERRADRVVDAVLAWLESAPERFFLWVHFYDPHSRYDPPRGFASAFASRPYDGEIAFADAQLGRLLAALGPDASRQLVVVTSDHGESLGEHGEATHSYLVYDATQRVPLLLRGPGLPAGLAVEVPVRLLDLAPTLLELAGAPGLGAVEGRSLLPLVAGRDLEPRSAYLETLATQLDLGWSPLVGLRAGGWKYIRAPRPELYELGADPAELDNRADREPEVVARLERALEARSAGARPPLADVELGAQERELLEGLGYAVPDADPPVGLGVVGGPDPKDRIHQLRAFARAESELDRGRPARALAALDAIDESGAHVSALRASAALAAGDPARAAGEARRALAGAPQRDDMWILLGRAEEAQRRWDEAREAYARAAAADPDSQEAWAGLARTLERLGRSADAARARARAAPRQAQPM